MSQLSDAIAAAKASEDALDAALTDLESRVSTDLPALQKQVTDLTAQVAALQAQIDAGNSDPALVQAVTDLQAQIDAAKARIANVDPATPTPSPDPNPVPTPTPTPTPDPNVNPTPAP